MQFLEKYFDFSYPSWTSRCVQLVHPEVINSCRNSSTWPKSREIPKGTTYLSAVQHAKSWFPLGMQASRPGYFKFFRFFDVWFWSIPNSHNYFRISLEFQQTGNPLTNSLMFDSEAPQMYRILLEIQASRPTQSHSVRKSVISCSGAFKNIDSLWEFKHLDQKHKEFL